MKSPVRFACENDRKIVSEHEKKLLCVAMTIENRIVLIENSIAKKNNGMFEMSVVCTPNSK